MFEEFPDRIKRGLAKLKEFERVLETIDIAYSSASSSFLAASLGFDVIATYYTYPPGREENIIARYLMAQFGPLPGMVLASIVNGAIYFGTSFAV